MDGVPQLAPVTQLQRGYKPVFERLQNGPVFLTLHHKALAVLVDAEDWDRMTTELKHYRLLAEGRANAARAESNDSWVSQEEMKQVMSAHVDN